MRLPIEDRAWAIYRKAAEAHGLTGYVSSLGDRRTKEKPPLIAKYLAGEIIETDIYFEAYKEFGDLAKRIREEFKKGGL